MTDMKKYFSYQLANCEPNSGDFLGDRTFDRAVIELMTAYPTHVPGASLTEDQAQKMITEKIQELKKHAGEYQLYYMLETVKPGANPNLPGAHSIDLEVRVIWESDLAELEQLEYLRGGDGDRHMSMPRFRKKQVSECRVCGDTKLVEGLDFYGCTPSYETCGACHCAPD